MNKPILQAKFTGGPYDGRTELLDEPVPVFMAKVLIGGNPNAFNLVKYHLVASGPPLQYEVAKPSAPPQ